MANYLAIIRKADFTDIFKYGYLNINSDMIVEFSCNVKELPQHKEICSALFAYANPFDYSFSYLIIHFKTEGQKNRIYIENIENIYPLDNEAKREIEGTFDERIRLESPLWQDSILELQKTFMYNSCLKGAQNLWNILRIKNSFDEFKNIIKENTIHEIIDEIFSDKRPSGNISFFAYLLRYERHGYFPKNNIGYVMDLVNIYLNFTTRHELLSEEIEHTDIYQLLSSYNDNSSKKKLKLDNLLRSLKQEKRATNFLNAVDNLNDNHKDFIDIINVSILYLMFSQHFNEGFSLSSESDKSWIKNAIKYGNDFYMAIFLLGIKLGHEKTYDCLYETLPLKIFKPVKEKEKRPVSKGNVEGSKSQKRPFPGKKQETSLFPNSIPETSETPKNIISKDKTGPIVNNVPPVPNQGIEPRQYPIKMRLKGKGGRAKTIKNESEYLKYKAKGYIIVK